MTIVGNNLSMCAVNSAESRKWTQTATLLGLYSKQSKLNSPITQVNLINNDKAYY